ncbi:amyloid-beta A4 protein-like [Condylostylus longicornis]|uniref:amyloid-beta A4 protein-like n=1 Tax=Condylostylus longicornis TaxID=2530218 RepID=UPI00244E0F3A|nr:amyloid-beta A4 protein-like [Condylostylus longicornis]
MKILIISFCIILSCKTILSLNTEIQDIQQLEDVSQTGVNNRKHNHHHHTDDLKSEQVDFNSPIIPPIEQNDQQQILEPRLAVQETPSGIPIIPPGTPTSDVCNLQMETGPCRAAFPRFYFVPSKADCEPFLYGGCEGNYNNFATYDECMQFCTAGYIPQSPILPGLINNKGTEGKLLETNPMLTSSDATNNNDNNINNNDNDNESSSGNRHHNRWPIFGGLLAGFYSLLRHLFYW